jgi:transcription initiation factor TFIID subunit 5
VVSSSKIKASSGAAKKPAPGAAALKALNDATANLEKAKKSPDMSVPGIRRETRPYKSGAALAVYRGHAPNTPIWSVAFAPCGYYFASAGSDATARLWVTDKPVPVRLFTGHTSNSVHSVVFHPNCNYVLTGSEDKTARLWDIQTGKAVRVLNGCPSGIYKVDIDPSGRYAVGADLSGTVHLWDLATGKKVTEFRASRPAIPAAPAAASSQRRQHVNMIHSFAFSACGTALATGGDDRCVRVWDINKSTTDPSPIVGIPARSFPTRRTMILDLQYTQRNLLLSVGKYVAAIPAINSPLD